jgi:hypothetical protein
MADFYTYGAEKIALKSVYYEGTDAIKKGYVLCFNQDTVLDLTDGATIAEGAMCNGRYLRVEKPATANIPYGFVIAMENKTGPCNIVVAEPDGHAVQVFSDANVTIGDLLYAQNASYKAGATGVAAIGKALETIDRSVTNGLCGVRLGQYAADITSAEASINVRADNIESSTASMATLESSDVVVIKASASSMKLVADSVSTSVASIKTLESSDVVDIKSSMSSTKLVADSVSTSVASIKTLESSDVVDIKSSMSSIKLIVDSDVSKNLSISTRLSVLDSTATAVTSADTALSTVGSQVVAILDALKAVNG